MVNVSDSQYLHGFYFHPVSTFVKNIFLLQRHFANKNVQLESFLSAPKWCG